MEVPLVQQEGSVASGFERAQKNAEKEQVDFSFGTVDVWIDVLEVNSLNKTRQIMLYGKLQMPLLSQDIGVEEFDSDYLLPEDESFINYNQFIKASLHWSPEDVAAKYDKTIFKLSNPIWVRDNSILLSLKGEEQVLAVPQGAMKVDTSSLEESISEHWNDYSASKSAGMRFESTSEEKYVKQNEWANALVSNFDNQTQTVTQQEIDQLRVELNKSFGDLKPAPFERIHLQKLLQSAADLLQKNGSDGKRLPIAIFNSLNESVGQAQYLVSLPDLKTILAPEHQEVFTHRDFEQAAEKLEQVIHEIRYESYTPLDMKELIKSYNNAINLMPAKGFGFGKDSREVFLNALDHIGSILNTDKRIYLTSEEVDQLKSELDRSLKQLKEVALDSKDHLKVTVRYRHPDRTAVSSLINEYFKDGNGDPITDTLTVIPGQEVRISLVDPIIKKFYGFVPQSFHLNSDDSSLKLVRVLTNTNGKQVITFQADGANMQAGASLDIVYVLGEDGRVLVGANETVNAQSQIIPTPNKKIENESKKEVETVGGKTGQLAYDFGLLNSVVQKSEGDTSSAPLSSSSVRHNEKGGAVDSRKQQKDSDLAQTGSSATVLILFAFSIGILGIAAVTRQRKVAK